MCSQHALRIAGTVFAVEVAVSVFTSPCPLETIHMPVTSGLTLFLGQLGYFPKVGRDFVGRVQGMGARLDRKGQGVMHTVVYGDNSRPTLIKHGLRSEEIAVTKLL